MAATLELKFRRAIPNDIPLIVDTIVAAEKSGTDIFSYSTIFEMPEEEIRNILASILAEDVQGQELCISDYLIAEVDGKAAGAVAGWIESQNGQSSSVIKGTLLKYFFPEENLEKALEKRKILNEMHFDPSPGAMVIDTSFVLPDYRGQGVYAKLMLEQERFLLEKNPEVKIVQTHILKTSVIPHKICLKIGYHIVEEKKCSNPKVYQWLPTDTQIIFEKNLKANSF